MAGEDVGDEPSPGLRERHHLIALVVVSAGTLHQVAAEEIAHHHRGVGVASQELLAQRSLAQRAVVEQRLERAELADGQPRLPHDVSHPDRQRFRRAHQLDVRVQRGGLGGGTRIAGRHGSNSNRL